MSRLKDYFHFQKEEQLALLFLIAVIIGVLGYIQIDKRRLIKSTDSDFSDFEQKILDFEKNISTDEVIAEPTDLNPKKDENHRIVLKMFNPNGLSIEQWVSMGLTIDQAKVIKNYENKGGRFYSKEDVKKMYSISSAKFEELEPYIAIKELEKPAAFAEKEWMSPYEENEGTLLFDLNSVDSVSLLKVSGIGPAFASRILRFREASGGFNHKEQLRDIWGMDQERYNKIEESFFVDSSYHPLKININTATAAEMKEHPYISWNVANSIEKYRNQNGRYSKIEGIKKSHLVSDSLFNKLKPYLKLKEENGK